MGYKEHVHHHCRVCYGGKFEQIEFSWRSLDFRKSIMSTVLEVGSVINM